jgi:hypothetical protein
MNRMRSSARIAHCVVRELAIAHCVVRNLSCRPRLTASITSTIDSPSLQAYFPLENDVFSGVGNRRFPRALRTRYASCWCIKRSQATVLPDQTSFLQRKIDSLDSRRVNDIAWCTQCLCDVGLCGSAVGLANHLAVVTSRIERDAHSFLPRWLAARFDILQQDVAGALVHQWSTSLQQAREGRDRTAISLRSLLLCYARKLARESSLLSRTLYSIRFDSLRTTEAHNVGIHNV